MDNQASALSATGDLRLSLTPSFPTQPGSETTTGAKVLLLGLVLVIAGLTLACQPGQGRLPERQPDPTLDAESGSGPEPERERVYVGSQASSACHLEIYEAWQTTSHS